MRTCISVGSKSTFQKAFQLVCRLGKMIQPIDFMACVVVGLVLDEFECQERVRELEGFQVWLSLQSWRGGNGFG